MKYLISILFSLMTALSSAHAQIKIKSVHDVVDVTLLPGWRMENGQHMAGIAIKMLPGWRTYWRAPGDGGIPTRISWRGSQNLKSAKILWPRPEVFRTFGLRSVGYVEEVVFPILIHPESDGSIKINAQMDFGVCEEICLPVRLKISGVLPAENRQPDAAIKASLKTLPQSASQGKVRKATCGFTPSADGIKLKLRIDAPRLPGQTEVVLIEPGDRRIWISEPKSSRRGQTFQALALMVPQAPGLAISRKEMRITLMTDKSSVEILGCDPS